MNTLPKSLLLGTLLAVAGGSAFAQSSTFGVSGSVVTTTCVLVFSATATGASITSLLLATIPTPGQFPTTTAGLTTATTATADKFFVKALNSAGGACSGTKADGTAATNYNFTIASPNGVDTNGKALPGSGTTAGNVTIDLVPSAGTFTGLNLVQGNTTPASQHGIPSTVLATSGTTTAPFFTPKFYKTSTTNPVTAGNVNVSYTFTAQYP